jgi:hypothetical protein
VSEGAKAKPEWVRAIDAGLVPPIAAEASRPLERDALLGEARARLGLPDGGVADFCHADFDADRLLEPLDRVLAALEGEAALTLTGRWLTRRFLLRLLEVRLQLMAYLRADPGVRDEPIAAPLFVAGAPRTGTTILHALLAADPAHRAPLGWELLRPVPPPDPDAARRASDARIALADRELVLPQTVVTGLLAIHEYGARRPKECLSAMSFAFLSEEFTARYHVPSYEAWLERADPTPAYAMHRLVLQVLQRRTGPASWVLKSPVHLHALPTLFAVYPDARVAVTHRDPLVMLASLTSLIAALRRAHSDRVDEAAIAAAHARRWRETLGRLVRWSDAEAVPAAQMHHSPYADTLRDPLATVAALYARFGRPLPAATQARMRAALLARPRDEHGAHAYSFDALGLDRAALRESFRAYRTRFGVSDEAGAGGA